MSQISPPIRILLVCAVAFMAAWMLLLKPKSEPAAQAPAPAPNVQTDAPAVSTAGQVVESAQEAAGTAPAAESEAAATATAPTGAVPVAGAPAAAVPASGLRGVPKPVKQAIKDEKTLVVLFWNDKSADDRAVRASLRKIDRWNGRVFVHAAPLSRISRYGRITRGVDVSQSPTVVVVDPEMRAETLVGWVDTQTIDQAVIDALRNSTGMFTSTYLREINSTCAKFANSIWAMPGPDSAGQVAGYVTTARGRTVRFSREFRAIPAPKRYRGLRKATVAANAEYVALFTQWATFLGSNPSNTRVVASLQRFGPDFRKLGKSYNRRMDKQNVLSCGSQA